MSSRMSIVASLALGAVLSAAVVGGVSVLAPSPPPPRVSRPPRPATAVLPMTPEARRIVDGYLIEARKGRQFHQDAKAIENGEMALKLLRDRGRDLEAARLLVELGEWYVDAGDVSRGAAYFRSAFAQGADGSTAEWREVADRAESAHRDLAFSLSDRAQDGPALAILEEMLKEFRRRGDRLREAQSLHNQAWVISDNGRPEEAVRLYGRAWEIRRSIGDREGQAWTLNNMGVALRRAGDLEGSKEKLLGALEGAGKEFPAVWSQGLDNLLLLVREAREKKAYPLALSALDAVLPALRERDELFLYERVWLERALASRESGDFGKALEALSEIIAWERRAKYDYGAALFLYETGRTLAMAGKVEEALGAFRETLEIQKRIGDPRGAATTQEAAGRSLLAAGRTREARDWLLEAAAGFEAAGPDRGSLRRLLPDLADCCDSLRDAEGADRARRRIEEEKSLPPLEDLPRFVYIEGCEGREVLIAGMRTDGVLIRIRRIGDDWRFLDEATGRQTPVPFAWAGRHVVFQGKDFRVEGPLLSHQGFTVFLAAGEEAAVAVNGKFFRVVH